MDDFLEFVIQSSQDNSKDNYRDNYLIFKPNYFILFYYSNNMDMRKK
jgi:hypothetical protein